MVLGCSLKHFPFAPWLRSIKKHFSPHQAFSLERKQLTKRQELPHQTPLLLRLLESLTNGILLQSNAPGQKEDDIDYAVYSKEPSQLMKEQLGNG